MDINNCRVIFWDLGGQAKLRTIWKNYYSDAHGLLFVVDSADHERFVEAKETLYGLINHPELKNLPLLLCANKQDLHIAKSVKEISEFFQLPLDSTSFNYFNSLDSPSRIRAASASFNLSNSNSNTSSVTTNSNINPSTSTAASQSGLNIGTSRSVKVQSTSAITMRGVDEGIRWIVNQAIKYKSSKLFAQPT